MIHLDIETFSSEDLAQSGVYRYTQSSDFEVLLVAYSIDGAPVKVLDLASGEVIPEEIKEAILDYQTIKWAHNAQFERICLSKHFGVDLSPDSWRCTMVHAAYLGLPLSLAGAAQVLTPHMQKLTEGKDLIRYFSMPCKPTKANGQRTRNLPSHDPDKWSRFKAYNARDVEAEMAIHQTLSRFPMPESEWENYKLDQRINDRGILIDQQLANAAIEADQVMRQEMLEKMTRITNLENPNSVAQMRAWLADKGLETDSLDKAAVKDLLKTAPGELAEVLELRQQISKSSVKKYQAMKNSVCRDGRARGLLQFYGANRTGRFAGRLIQVQNLPQNHLPDLEEARNLVRSGQFDMLDALYDSPADVLSQLIRTAFIPKKGCKFIVSDFSAIEARVIAWLAGETWRNEVFASHGKIYEASAAQMFHVPIDEVTKGSPLRQKGKVAELACIAQGELVLTDQGLVPIECVEPQHKLWDGSEWVAHEGVVDQGIREVIEYQGLKATKDHRVWVEGSPDPMEFSAAAAAGAHLVHFGLREKWNSQMKLLGLTRVYDIQNAGPNNRYTVSGKLVHNCGYGGSVGALKAMGALEMGVEEGELKGLIEGWRAANPKIVAFWWAVDRAVKDAIQEKRRTQTHGIYFEYRSSMLLIHLPSGRHLSYVKPQMGKNRFGGESVIYQGVGATKKWEKIESYGPKFVENIVQAIARDILCFAMQELDKAGHRIVMHVHDEVVIEEPLEARLEEITELMGKTPPWANALLLRADGYECKFYKKD